MTIIRKAAESPLRQGTDEEIAYTVNTAPWGGYSSGAQAKLFDITREGQRTDVTSTLLFGSTTESGGTITTPLVRDLIPGRKYRLEVLWVYSGNTFEVYAEIEAEY